jgi:uncharacterized protein
MSAAARVLLFAVRVYQTFFSGLMPSACKFYPSCSHYAADALRIHGARRGTWLALRRLARCHPFTRGGVDLVPGANAIPSHLPPQHEQAAEKLQTCHSGRSEKSLLGLSPARREILRRKPRLRMTRKSFFGLFSLSDFSAPRSESRQAEVADPGVAGACPSEEAHT